MTELFTDYSVEAPQGEVFVARRLADEDLVSLRGCVVSHPDEGGRCLKPAALEVYGENLPFCEAHGLEAYHGALSRFLYDASEERHPRHMLPDRASAEELYEESIRHAREHSRWLREAYPVIEDRVDQITLEWDPTDLDPAYVVPVDYWSDPYWQVCSFMLSAALGTSPWLAEELEPLRERLAAQCAFADVIHEQKVAALRASNEG